MATDQDDAIPPRGWQQPREDGAQQGSDSLQQLVEQLLSLVPDDLRGRLTEALHQLLEAIRELIDWCVARLEQRESNEVEVRDIPIL